MLEIMNSLPNQIQHRYSKNKKHLITNVNNLSIFNVDGKIRDK